MDEMKSPVLIVGAGHFKVTFILGVASVFLKPIESNKIPRALKPNRKTHKDPRA